MSAGLIAFLRRRLVADYASLKQRLTHRFGSADLAGEVLNEAWLRLDRVEGMAADATVRDPSAYLYRVAVNIALDQKRAEARQMARAEIDVLCREAVDELDPGRVAEARSQLAALAHELDNLPPRRRAIFIASRLENLPHKAIAQRLGITVRIVDRELAAALRHFSEVLEKKMMPRRGPRPPKTS